MSNLQYPPTYPQNLSLLQCNFQLSRIVTIGFQITELKYFDMKGITLGTKVNGSLTAKLHC